jgi:hypothetical protein
VVYCVLPRKLSRGAGVGTDWRVGTRLCVKLLYGTPRCFLDPVASVHPVYVSVKMEQQRLKKNKSVAAIWSRACN